jgi:hypothetical protein
MNPNLNEDTFVGSNPDFMIKNCKNLLNFLKYFCSNSLRTFLHRGKHNIQQLLEIIKFLFSFFWGHVGFSRIRIHSPSHIQIQSGSGSATLIVHSYLTASFSPSLPQVVTVLCSAATPGNTKVDIGSP